MYLRLLISKVILKLLYYVCTEDLVIIWKLNQNLFACIIILLLTLSNKKDTVETDKLRQVFVRMRLLSTTAK